MMFLMKAASSQQARQRASGLAADLPVTQGYRLPAEWEPHAATWLAWPHRQEDWPGKYAPVPWVFVEIIRQLVASEPVRLLVASERLEERAVALLVRSGVSLSQIEFWRIATDRCWLRDSGPLFLTGPRGRALLDWQFRGWNRYRNWQRDNAVPARINHRLRLPAWQPCWHGRRIVLEGGSLDVNGQGCLLTTEDCLLSPQQCRNPGLGREDYERLFHDYLGVQKVLWLGQGLVGDDTHGHIDELARFVGPRTVVAVLTQDRHDPNYAPLQDNWQRLQRMTDQDGRPLEVLPLPLPRPRFFNGQRLPASYANFYIANRCVLVPTFNDPADRQALNLLAQVFPDREVVGIYAGDLVWGLGALHCLTQQEPAG
jgi:agmatine deiminase